MVSQIDINSTDMISKKDILCLFLNIFYHLCVLPLYASESENI